MTTTASSCAITVTRKEPCLGSIFCRSRAAAFAVVLSGLATALPAQSSSSAAIQAAQTINAKQAAATFPNNPASLLNNQGTAPPPLQATDPEMMRQINALNAETAKDTFGDSTELPSTAADSPSSPQSSYPSNSTNSSNSSSPGSSGLGAFGFGPMASDNGAGDSSGSTTQGGSSVAPSPDTNSPANVPQASAQTQPPIQDATTSSQSPDSVTGPVNPTPAPLPTTKPRRAIVTYAASELAVQADDSSLNLILRQIASLTGMKITGGVAEERVFGNYGPAKPSAVISALLDGTGSDMVLRQDAHATITELILIPRGGGAVPPGPNARIWDLDEAQGQGKGK